MEDFIKDGPLLKELRLLTGLADQQHATHVELAKLAGISPAMVNNYMARLRERGLVRRIGTSSRTTFYELSEAGASHRERLLIDYNAELIRLYKTARCEIAGRIETLVGREPVSICLCPAGDTAEVVLSISAEFPNIAVQAILDDSPDKQASCLLGHPVLPFSALVAQKVDGVFIATIAFGDQIEKRIREVVGNNVRLWRLF